MARMTKLIVWHDGACPLCRREIALMRRLDRRGAIRFVDATESGAACPIDRADLLARFHASEDGILLSGAAAFAAMWRAIPLSCARSGLAARVPLGPCHCSRRAVRGLSEASVRRLQRMAAAGVAGMRPRPDPVGPGQESVWSYPRPAARRGNARAHIVIEHRGHRRRRYPRQRSGRWRPAIRQAITSRPAAYHARACSDRPGGGSFCEWKGACGLLGRHRRRR